MTLGTIADGAIIPNVVKLKYMEELSYYFPNPPSAKMVHLVIRASHSGECQPFTPSCHRD